MAAMSAKRTTDELAYVLHRYDWSETSLILDVFTRQHGRLALVAKGAKRPNSQLRPVLLPLQPLLLAWGGDAEVRTLKSAHWCGGHVMPVGEALLVGTYFNEMLMRLLARDDPHPHLFDGYGKAVEHLARRGQAPAAAVLRAFELLLLRESGVLPSLDSEGSSLQGVEAKGRYVLSPEGGLHRVGPDARGALSGALCLDLQAALDATGDFDGLIAACQGGAAALQNQLRTLLHYHCGVQAFQTRQMMRDVQALVRLK
jgi:DNA repair protein RecO (recombination protein O)